MDIMDPDVFRHVLLYTFLAPIRDTLDTEVCKNAVQCFVFAPPRGIADPDRLILNIL